MICCSILKPFSYRSSRRMHLTATEPLSIRYLPILRISSSICFASSRVGVRQSACSSSPRTTLSIPRTSTSSSPCCATAPAGCAPPRSRQRRRPDLRRHTNFISYSALSRFSGSASRVVERGDGDRCSASFGCLVEHAVRLHRAAHLVLLRRVDLHVSAGAASADVIASTPAPLAARRAPSRRPRRRPCAVKAQRRSRAARRRGRRGPGPGWQPRLEPCGRWVVRPLRSAAACLLPIHPSSITRPSSNLSCSPGHLRGASPPKGRSS